MDPKVRKMTSLVSILGTLSVLLALCCATILRGFYGTIPMGARYCMLAIAGLFTLTIVIGILTYRMRNSRP